MEDLGDFPNNFYPFYTQFINQVLPSIFMSIHILTKHGAKMWSMCFSKAVVNVPEPKPSRFKRTISMIWLLTFCSRVFQVFENKWAFQRFFLSVRIWISFTKPFSRSPIFFSFHSSTKRKRDCVSLLTIFHLTIVSLLFFTFLLSPQSKCDWAMSMW